DRQAMLDAFATARGPATLLAQLDVGPLDLRRLSMPLVAIVTEPAYVPPPPPAFVPPPPPPPLNYPQPRLRDRIIERIPIINR
ncbi:hypothetical protein PXH80_33675, partial [Mycolicibacterium smegmatis]|uniref:DUF7157 domain-containing protein n=1 Tax=Mycolicibacterium smegmatis TaxID=1772 RepID=UPI002A65C74A|nr:hypothetical protein [Mycolicibacterium smegmatis]